MIITQEIYNNIKESLENIEFYYDTSNEYQIKVNICRKYFNKRYSDLDKFEITKSAIKHLEWIFEHDSNVLESVLMLKDELEEKLKFDIEKNDY